MLQPLKSNLKSNSTRQLHPATMLHSPSPVIQTKAEHTQRRRFSRNARLVMLEVAGRSIDTGKDFVPNEAKAVWFVCSGESTAEAAAPARRRDTGGSPRALTRQLRNLMDVPPA
jgi:hypothetical protein